MSAPWESLGLVTVTSAGTPVRASSNEPDPTLRSPAKSMFFQQVTGNVGKIWIMDRATGNKSTGVGVLAVLAAPSLNDSLVDVSLPSASVTDNGSRSSLDVSQVWIDADNDGETCRVSVVR